MDGSFVNWADAHVHVMTHSLHYGLAAFEGLRCYKGKSGSAIFRLQEHVDGDCNDEPNFATRRRTASAVYCQRRSQEKTPTLRRDFAKERNMQHTVGRFVFTACLS